jgi:hypothetical protein
MKKKIKKQKPDELRPEYDFSKLKNGVLGKYAARFNAGNESRASFARCCEVFS